MTTTTLNTTEPQTTEPTFSANTDTPSLRAALKPLLRSSGGRWELTAKGNGLERSFRFRTFKKTWEFMNAVAAECAIRRHHPEWSNVYNTTFIRWTTHSPPGLSAKDIEMARFCDEQGVVFGENVETPVEPVQPGDAVTGQRDVGKELADRVAVEGGDCCVPKGKKGT